MRPRPLIHAALPALVFAVSAIWLVARVELDPGARGFHVDEAHKIAEARFFYLFFVEGDFGHPAWRADFFARTNPPVGKYLFGAVLAASGHPVRDGDLQDAFMRHWRRPEALRAEVPDAQLRVVRTTSALCAALVVLLVFTGARAAGGSGAGLVAAALLLGNGLFLDAARLGMTDTLLLATLALVVPVTLRAWRSLARPREAAVFAVGVPGLAIALAAGVKLNGALSGLVFGASLILLAASARTAVRRRSTLGALAAVGLAGALSLVLFVAMNPFLWHAPVASLWNVWIAYGDWMRGLQIDPGFPLLGLEQRALTALHSGFQSPRLLAVRGLGGAGTFLLASGFVCGLLALAAHAVRGARGGGSDGRGAAGTVLLVWALFLLAGMSLWAPLDWDRYALPPYLGLAAVTGVGLAAAAGRLAGAVRQRSLPYGPAGAAALATCLAAGVAAVLLPGTTGRALLTPVREAGPPEQYRAALARRPGEPLLWRHLGLAQLRARRPGEAASSFEAALRRLPPAAAGEAGAERVLGAILSWDLALAQARAGQPELARRALAEHAAILAELRDGARSQDPYVRERFDRIASERTAWLESAQALPAAAHP